MSNEVSLIVEKQDSVAVLTINRPEAFNTVSVDLLERLYQAQEDIERDSSIRAVLIKANGDNFSAGIDLNLLSQVNSQFVMEKLNWLQKVYGRWQELPVPVIAAVHGICYGSAVELILGCDIRIAADDTRLAIPEVRFGLSPDMGGTTRLTHLVGIGQAKRLIMGCDEIGAEEALRIGLVEKVVKKEELIEKSMKMAVRMATTLPPVAMRFAKFGINLANESSVAAGLLFEQAQSTYCCGTEDQKEAIAAFFEKRKPILQGK